MKTTIIQSPPLEKGDGGGFAVAKIPPNLPFSKGGILVLISLILHTVPLFSDVQVSTPTAVPGVAVSSGALILTLPQSIQLALQGATDVLKAKNNLDFTGTQLWQAYLEFLPNLEASGNYVWTSGRAYFVQTTPATVRTTNRSMNYSLSSTLNLFNGFADTAALRSGRGLKQAAALTLFRARQQIVLDITQAYLQVLLDRDIIRFAQTNAESSRQREQLLTAQSEVGARSLADLYRQQAQTSADELFLIQSQNRALDDLILLLRRLRVDLTQDYDLADAALDSPTAANPYTDQPRLIQQALDQRADLRALRESMHAAEAEVTFARSGYFPRLDLGAGLSGYGDLLDRQIVDGVDILPVPQNSLGHQLGTNVLYDADLNLTWGLFDRFTTRTAVARAQQTAKDTQIDYQDLKLEVEGEVRQAINDYRAALQQLEAAAKGVQSAQESYDAVQERYKVGASSIVDLLTAQSALVQAQTSDAQARIGYALQLKVMDNVLGVTPF